MNGQIRIWVDQKFAVSLTVGSLCGTVWNFVYVCVWHCVEFCVCVCVCVALSGIVFVCPVGGGGGAHEYSFLSTSSRFIQTTLFSLSLSGQHGLPHQSSKI